MRAALVESNAQVRSRMRRFVEELSDRFEIVAEYEHFDDLVKAPTPCGIEVIFVDIDQRANAGFEALERWGSSSLKVVMLALNKSIGFRIVNPESKVYTLRPIPALKLYESLDQAQDTSPSKRIALSLGQRIHLVPLVHIDVAVAKGNYLEVISARANYVLRCSLKDFQAKLDPGEFVRLHRSVIVRINAIHEVKSAGSGRFRVRLHGGYTFHSGRLFRDQIHSLLGIL